MNTTEEEKIVPKFNVPIQMNYGSVMNFEALNGSQIQREVITDTYVTASENEDEMIMQIDKAAEILRPKCRGFAGYLSFFYLQLTLFYIMKKYELCLKAVESIERGIDAIERQLFTGNYLDENGNESGFVNYTFGEDDVKQTTKYIHDAWNTAKLIHSKAASFESGYSLIVTSIILYSYNKQNGMIRKECEYLRNLVNRIKEFIINERDNPSHGDIIASADMEFASIEDLKKENEENND